MSACPPPPFFEQVCFVLGSHAGGARLAFARMRALRKENRKEFLSSRPSSADIEDKSYSSPPPLSSLSQGPPPRLLTIAAGKLVGGGNFPFLSFFVEKKRESAFGEEGEEKRRSVEAAESFEEKGKGEE